MTKNNNSKDKQVTRFQFLKLYNEAVPDISERIYLKPICNLLFNVFNNLTIQNMYVDVGHASGTIEFMVDLGNDIIITAVKSINTVDDNFILVGIYTENGLIRVDLYDADDLKLRLNSLKI